jgi:DNA-directed RNA polymerase subunit RPC12/RpoP
MCLDAGKVLKRSVLCSRCKEDYLLTLRSIAEDSQLRCPGCGAAIGIGEPLHEPLVSEVRNILEAIDCAQLAPSFISRHPTRSIQFAAVRREELIIEDAICRAIWRWTRLVAPAWKRKVNVQPGAS